MNANDELRLIARAQKKPAAFEPLYHHYVHLVWNYCLGRLRDRTLAEDATSTTFMKAMDALPRYRPQLRGDQTTFRSWLMMIARNVVLDELRRRPMAVVDDHSHILASPLAGPEQIALARDRHEQLLTAFSQLSDQQQDVIRLRQQGLSGEEIGEILGISTGAVKSTHYRAVQRLRELLQEKGEQS
ncbi:MAG: sigma-70 family RNA polymerase sigma factor [Thermomicrobiales bacterium]|nr:sigma-70 family RNA polymerase sigma factor [Thermomicrobiales bacterium]MCO5224075.1 sigma-70 family RNA polymerase sigma factor [Thermomicrobiales bacterium]